MRIARFGTACTAMLIVLTAVPALADEAPIAGAIVSVDAASGIVTVQAPARGGRPRTVAIHVRPESRIVRFARPTGGGPHVEQAATLADLRPGWMVSVKTRHEGDREVAEVLRVVHEP